LVPHGLEEAPDPPVVAAVGPFAAGTGNLATRMHLRAPEAGELVQRPRPIEEVAELEVGVARMIADRAPGLGIAHPVDHRAVAAGGLAEHAAMLARRERPELAIDVRHDLARQIVGVAPDGGGVHVLIAAE